MTKHLRGSGGGGGAASTPTIEPDSLLSEDVVEMNLGICAGPIAGLVHGPHTFYVDDTPLVSKSGDSNFSSFEVSLYSGTSTASVVKNTLGGITSNEQVGLGLTTATPITRTTTATLRNQVDAIEVRILVSQLFKVEDDGDQREATAEFAVRYRQAGSQAWKSFGNAATLKIKGKTTGGYVKEFTINVPRVNADWEIQVEQISDDSNPQYVVDMAWESFQLVTKENRAYDNVAVVRAVGKVSEEFSGNPNFTGVYGTKIVRVPTNFDPLTRHYAGAWDGTFKFAFTDSLPWILYDLLVDDVHGFRRHYPNLLVDRFSFYDAAANWADKLVERSTGGYQPRFTFSRAFQEPKNAFELVNEIAGVMNGILISDLNGTVRLKVDKPDTVVQIFGPESVVDGLFTYQFTDVSQRVNDIRIRFVNPNLGWVTDYRQVKDDAAIAKYGRIPTEVDALGCIDPHEAERRAFRRLLQATTETASVTFQTARAGLALELFDKIGIADPKANWGLSGRIKSVAGNTITLRDPLLVPVNTDLTLTLQLKDGPQDLTVRSTVATTTTLTIVGGSYPASAPDRPQFALTAPGTLGLVKPFRIVNLTPDSDNPDLIQITAHEVNENKYGDADSLTASGVINYSGVLGLNTRPAPPVITRAETGASHQVVQKDGTVQDRIYLEWSQEAATTIDHWDVRFRREGEPVNRSMTFRSKQAYIPVDVLDKTFTLEVVAIGSNGKSSLPSNQVQVTPGAPNTAPAVPTGWTALPVIGGVQLEPPSMPTPAHISYRAYVAASGAGFAAANLVRDVGPAPILIEDPAGTDFYVTAVDRFGNESGPSNVIVGAPRLAGYDDVAQQIADDIAAAAEEAADAAAAVLVVDGKVNGVRSDHDALTAGFLGNLVDGFAGVEGEIDTLQASQGVLQADVTKIKGLTVENGTAFAVLMDQLAVNAGGTSATISHHASVVAETEGFASAFTGISAATSGGYISELFLSAWEDPDGSGGSAIKLSAEYIILEGTVATDQLVVGLGRNLMTNTDFLDGMANWTWHSGTSTVHAQTTLQLRQAGQTYAGKYLPTLWLYQGNDGQDGSSAVTYRFINADNSIENRAVAIEPGKYYVLSAYFGAYRCDGRMDLIFRDKDGVWISSSHVNVSENSPDPDNPEEWQRVFVKGLAPANAAFIQPRFQKFGTIPPNADSSVFIYKPQLEESHEHAKGPSPYSPPGTAYFSGGRLYVASLKAEAIDTVDFAVAGLSIFGGDLKSTDFLAGVSGWKIAKNGDAEFNQLIVRESIVSGGVSDVWDYYVGGSTSGNKSDTWAAVKTHTIGRPVTAADAFLVTLAYDHRYNSKIKLEMRRQVNGVWQNWEDVVGSEETASFGSTWDDEAFGTILTGRGSDLAVRVTHWNSSIGSGTQYRDINFHVRSVQK